MNSFGKIWAFALLSLISCQIIAQPLGETPRDRAYEEITFEERRSIPYDNLREADVFWENRVWRVIDFKEKLNLPFSYPKLPFAQLLIDVVKSNEATAYNPIDDEFLTPYTSEQLESKLYRIDTIPVYDPDTYEETIQIVESEFDPVWVTKLWIKEDWIFDEETSSMICRVSGVAPVRELIDENSGLVIGDELMFWLYYPEIRAFLAKKPVFNPWNDAVRMSWEDIFEMRLFSSYIIKESNVYDRTVENYATGIDAVLESERLKKDLFKFEHELWEF
ncbi:MAG: gliding motility associated protein GldN [Limisphaerales bacterium]|jgi:gliding motility associated protien GldN